VADEMGLGMTFTLFAAAMICKLVTKTESCNGVATVHVLGEYPGRVGDFRAQQLSRHCQ
jgi:hypothetical protein